MIKTINNAKRIVIKIGSATIANESTGRIRDKWLKTLAEDIAALHKKGKEIAIVTSGSVAIGKRHINNINTQDLKLEEKQAAAACGQIELMRHYQKCLDEHSIYGAQILLTIQDSGNRRNYLNAVNTLDTLISKKVIPIINENDTVTTEEIRLGDNDRLAARVAQMISADLLILLSDIDGLYTENPHLDNDAKHIDTVKKVTKEIKDMAGGSMSSVGSGGMITKIEAAKMANDSGCTMILGHGNAMHPIASIGKKEKYTLFKAKETPLSAKKTWLLGALKIHGEIIIDNGAVKALNNGKSLLPAGVIDVKGDFERGDAIVIKDCKLKEIARGLSTHSSEDAKLIKGHKSNEIANIIGFSGRDELVHRDNMVMVD